MCDGALVRCVLKQKNERRDMTNKGNAFVSFVVMALGVLSLWLSNQADLLHGVVLLCGVAFILPAVISLLSLFFVGKANRQPAGQRLVQLICGVGGLGLGVCIILMPEVFRPLLVYLFAALLVVGGAFQVFLISRRSRPVNYPSWLLIVPILVIVCGVVMCCFDAFHDAAHELWVVVATGVALVLYGVNGILVSVLGFSLLRKVKKLAAAEAAAMAENAETTNSATHKNVGGENADGEASVVVGSDGLNAESATDVEGD